MLIFIGGGGEGFSCAVFILAGFIFVGVGVSGFANTGSAGFFSGTFSTVLTLTGVTFSGLATIGAGGLIFFAGIISTGSSGSAVTVLSSTT